MGLCDTCDEEGPQKDMVQVNEDIDGEWITQVCGARSDHLHSPSATYCCGMIYEEREEVCASCGGWL